jgi:hypothetical protein
MTSNSSHQPSELNRYLARCGFTLHAGNRTWLDRDTGQQIIRVVRELGEQTELIALTPPSACLYKAIFSPGTPDDVIIAAIKAALSPRHGSARTRPGRPQATGARTKEHGDLR